MTPPGDRNVGEIVLRDLCALLPAEQLCVFSAGAQKPEPGPYQTCAYDPPDEQAWRPFPGRIGGLCNTLRVRIHFTLQVKKMVQAVCEFAKEQQVEQIWLVLNSLSLIGAGKDIAHRLDVPLRCLVWDPPSYLCAHKKWDQFSRKWIEQRFFDALECSVKVMVVSQQMADEYRKKVGADCVIVRHARDLRGDDTAAARNAGRSEHFLIGFAGTLYDKAQIMDLLHALHHIQWRVGDRPVRVRILSNQLRCKGIHFPCHVEYLGRQESEDTVQQLLEECHLNYLPVPFDKTWREFSQLSFPTKWTSYLSAGRPVLTYGPACSSSIRFCSENGLGPCCTVQDPLELAKVIESFCSSSSACANAEEAGKKTRQVFFSREVMKRQFFKFMDIERAEE